MADSVVKNVEKDRDRDLTYVGVSGNWKRTVAQVVSSIESGTNTFSVMCPQRADVVVRSAAGGRKFLKTTSDTTTKNNLDSLPPLSERSDAATTSWRHLIGGAPTWVNRQSVLTSVPTGTRAAGGAGMRCQRSPTTRAAGDARGLAMAAEELLQQARSHRRRRVFVFADRIR